MVQQFPGGFDLSQTQVRPVLGGVLSLFLRMGTPSWDDRLGYPEQASCRPFNQRYVSILISEAGLRTCTVRAAHGLEKCCDPLTLQPCIRGAKIILFRSSLFFQCPTQSRFKCQ